MRRMSSKKDLLPILRAIRPSQRAARELRRDVEAILEKVRRGGDSAVRNLSRRFDGVDPRPLRVKPKEMEAALKRTGSEVIRALENAAANIRAFHEIQRRESLELKKPGCILAERIGPIEEVGVYAPGGLAPYASTLLMDVIPAQIAGCSRIVVCSSPKKEYGGGLAPTILAAARILGIEEIYKVGGAQAIAAMAYGTPTISPVSMICGPGNAYVNEAKRQVQGTVKIDSLAGPTEILILADESADPCYIAADLIGQVEHGMGALGILVSPSGRLADRVEEELPVQAARHPRARDLRDNLKRCAYFIQTRDIEDAVRVSNAIAPEHLEVLTRRPMQLVPHLKNAGAIFVGPYSPEPAGDYTAGPNHVLPTGGCARFASPLNVDDFLKKTSILRLSRSHLESLAEDTIALAEAEGFYGHAEAVRIRLKR